MTTFERHNRSSGGIPCGGCSCRDSGKPITISSEAESHQGEDNNEIEIMAFLSSLFLNFFLYQLHYVSLLHVYGGSVFSNKRFL